MERFNIYPNPSGNGYLINVQADAMSQFNTRMVIPLVKIDQAPKLAKTLNPVFEIEGLAYSMVTQHMAAVPSKLLKSPVANVSQRSDEIISAIDLLLQGF